MTAYERALEEQIAYLEKELARVRAERETPKDPPPPDAAPIEWAMRDPGFRQWLLRKQLEARP